MKLVSYLLNGNEQLALLHHSLLYNLDELHPDLPSSMGMLLNYWEDTIQSVEALNESIKIGRVGNEKSVAQSEIIQLATIPFPSSIREIILLPDNLESHFPLFQFINHHSVFGIGNIDIHPSFFSDLTCVPQLAVVIAKSGTNIPKDEAFDYIAGFVLLNKFQTNFWQQQLPSTAFNTAKSFDFCTVIGPTLLTLDEFLADETNEFSLDIPLEISHNGNLVFAGNLSNLPYKFDELIAHLSIGTTLHPGDIISCPIRLSSLAIPAINPGDTVSISSQQLGTLFNSIQPTEIEP